MMSDNTHQTIDFSKPSADLLPDLLAESMRQGVREGRLKPGEQLPSEPEFAESLGVSRTTLRDAVRILVSEGTLVRRRGVGTFVSNDPLMSIQDGLENLSSTTELIRNHGFEPGTSHSSWERIPASDYLAGILGLDPGTALLHFSRTRTANDIPVIHCEEYVSAQIIGDQTTGRLDGEWSLYDVLKGVQAAVVSAVCKVIPAVADQSLSARLNVPLHHPLLVLRQTHYSTDNRPILYCENYHNCDMIEFHVIRRC
jgi:GntR family transcriptional regulator